MLLQRDDPVVPLLQKMGEPLFLMDENPTAENIAKLIYEFTASSGFPIVECQLWETPHCFATYRASRSGLPSRTLACCRAIARTRTSTQSLVRYIAVAYR